MPTRIVAAIVVAGQFNHHGTAITTRLRQFGVVVADDEHLQRFQRRALAAIAASR